MEFDLRFLEPEYRSWLQHAIDGVNKAGTLHDPGAWNVVSAGTLIEANEHDITAADPVCRIIFEEMQQDGHSGYTASWTIDTLTQVAKNYRKWRKAFLRGSLECVKRDIDAFIERRYAEKFGDGEADADVRHSRVLHDLERSYLVQYVLDDQDRNILQYLLKMENVSHLGNEVLLEQIDEQFRSLT
jgi:hypothetical protein